MGKLFYNGPFLLILLLLPLISQPILASPLVEKDGASSTNNSSSTQQEFSVISSKVVLLFIIILFFSIVVVHMSSLIKIHFIPESIVVIIYGVIVGFIGNSSDSTAVHGISTFSPENFFLFILPIIIFEAGFSLQKQDFFRHLHIILVLAIIGTVISFVVTSVFLWGMGKLGISTELPWLESLLIGAITCAIDPVATLAIFKALDVDPTLYIIVMGESILNDGVSLILYQSVLKYTLPELWKPFLLFFVVFIGSVFIGVAVALILSLMLKYFKLSKFPALETIYVLIFSYLSYLIADSIGLSGIVSSFFSGIAFSQYGYYLLSKDTTHTVAQVLRTYSFIGETISFIYIGISLPTHDFTGSPILIFLTFLILVISRALSVFPTCYLFNKLNILDISVPIQIVMWFSGLRGAISFSLCLSDSFISSPFYNTIQTTILLIIYLTIGIFGMGTYPLLRVFNIKSTDHDNTLESIDKPLKESRLKYTFLSKIDKFLKVFFNISNGDQDISSTDLHIYQLETIDNCEKNMNNEDNSIISNENVKLDEQFEDIKLLGNSNK